MRGFPDIFASSTSVALEVNDLEQGWAKYSPREPGAVGPRRSLAGSNNSGPAWPSPPSWRSLPGLLVWEHVAALRWNHRYSREHYFSCSKALDPLSAQVVEVKNVRDIEILHL
ncbi:hypothetical protein Y1Q_0002405 [Alligator mississippiensis]|uniref:Uncharacterized protein n=1 Tax=Alligator mississippiensis TaxID=8496 RepID=A0A151N656_ALLMI|nr:hypothetical protein Y1Q_0002405 [Alligator mississippiensis]